jgi:hypothetical protein
MRENGFIAGSDARKEYYNALRLIYNAVRDRFRVFACIISTTSHPLFIGDKVSKARPQC